MQVTKHTEPNIEIKPSPTPRAILVRFLHQQVCKSILLPNQQPWEMSAKSTTLTTLSGQCACVTEKLPQPMCATESMPSFSYWSLLAKSPKKRFQRPQTPLTARWGNGSGRRALSDGATQFKTSFAHLDFVNKKNSQSNQQCSKPRYHKIKSNVELNSRLQRLESDSASLDITHSTPAQVI